ncbi:hypothetical protein [Exiguobacterium flavidum]|uniref:hypothetical protein n=1 Tax=Exiguobacterium flavidum TaxID=2184695 RepID=UPI000DF76462|nr:hypothetical protein [Exiguobacterium flavidum]
MTEESKKTDPITSGNNMGSDEPVESKDGQKNQNRPEDEVSKEEQPDLSHEADQEAGYSDVGDSDEEQQNK